MHVELLDADHPGWPEALKRLPHDFYHEPAYVRLDGRRIQAVPQAFLASEGEKLFFLPYLLRSCMPLAPDGVPIAEPADVVSPYGYPGLLLNEAGAEPDFARRALEALRQTMAARGICSGFFRMHPLLNAGVQSLFPPDLFTDNGETVAMDLRPDENTIWSEVREGHQNTINKCRKAGLVVRMASLSECLDEFLITYQQTMERVKAKPSYFFDREYFVALAGLPDRVHCAVAECEGVISAACIFFDCGGITQAHLGGTKTAFLSKSPFILLLYEAALAAKRRGSRFLHLGGGLGGADDMLLRFKAGFSRPHYRFATLRLITDEDCYRRLVEQRARELHVSPSSLLASAFFPAYRSGASSE